VTLDQLGQSAYSIPAWRLSVLHHVRQMLPDERLIYVADSGHVPYGDKSPEYIEQRSLTLTRFLVEQGADAIVIACNTATAAAAATLRSRFDIPIVGMEPAVKPAAARRRAAWSRAGDHRHAGERTLRGAAGALRRGGRDRHQAAQAGRAGGAGRPRRAGNARAGRALHITLLARGADTLILAAPITLPRPADSRRGRPGRDPDRHRRAVARQLQRRIEAELPDRASQIRPSTDSGGCPTKNSMGEQTPRDSSPAAMSLRPRVSCPVVGRGRSGAAIAARFFVDPRHSKESLTWQCKAARDIPS